jgi:SAM-dependent methyltransferase
MALYDTIGQTYSTFRKPDPRIASAILNALGDAKSVVNIGAGSGSYEPTDRSVLAIEPSETMIWQRSPNAAPCLQGYAESLPVATASVDAAMAILSMHHWSDHERGLREMRRVANKRAVLLTWIPDATTDRNLQFLSDNLAATTFWLTEDYFPEILAYDCTVFPRSTELIAMLERTIGKVQLTPLPIPHDCVDGFLCSYWRRPEAYLNADVRSAMSSFSRFDPEAGLAKLRSDLAQGHWATRNRDLLDLESLDLGYRIVTCEIS